MQEIKKRNPKHCYWSSEAVSEGHPDKVMDQIAGAILDAYMIGDKNAHVAVEGLFGGKQIIIGGEITSTSEPFSIKEIVRKTLREIGYNDKEESFNDESAEISTIIRRQSPDINNGVSKDTIEESGAGDQGTVFGFAMKGTPDYIALSYDIANKILLELKNIRNNEPETMPYLRPDAKSQVTVEYDETGEAVRIDTIVVSTSHKDFAETDDEMLKTIRKDVKEIVIPRVKEKYPEEIRKLFDDEIVYHINPAGVFISAAAEADTSTVGRKIVVDQCGAGTVGSVNGKAVSIMTPAGGGNYNGKDWTKSDVCAALMARYMSKNCVAAGIADYMSIELTYAIGVSKPVSVFVNTYGSAKNGLTDPEIATGLFKMFDLSIYGICKTLSLANPLYREAGAYGWFGRKPETVEKTVRYKDGSEKTVSVELFTWEILDKVDEIIENSKNWKN